MLDNTFPCAGWLIYIDYYRSLTEGTAYFGIWRQVGEMVFVLKHRLALQPEAIGKHRVYLPKAFRVSRGDIIGIHYSTIHPLDSGVIPFALFGDRNIEQTELHMTLNTKLYDEDIEVGTRLNLKDADGGVQRKAFALRANIVYKDPDTGLPGNTTLFYNRHN